MKIVRTKLVRITGKKYLMFFGLLFTAPKGIIKEEDLNHERIHVAQMKEMLYVFFYVWYVIEWLIRLPFGNAYRNISFEREAYDNQYDLNYLKSRKRFDFARHIKTRV